MNIYMSKLVLGIMDKVAENLISGLAGLAAGYIAAEGYKQFVSNSAKKSWEDDIGIHHPDIFWYLIPIYNKFYTTY